MAWSGKASTNLPELTASVARLITAWLAVEDPLVHAGRADLHAIVATELISSIARKAVNAFAEVVSEGERHRELMALWQRLEHREGNAR